MMETETQRFEFNDDAPYPTAGRVAKRVTRGVTATMYVERMGPGVYRVDSGSGDSYDVDLESGMCTCPDAGTRGPWCKHYFAVLFQTGELPSVVGTGVVVHDESDEGDDHAETADERQSTDEDSDAETLAERVERFEANNPGASAIEAISQLGINPDKRERVEEVLA